MSISNRKIVLCRKFLGLGMFLNYVFSLLHLKTYFEVPRFLGIELSFISIPQSMQTSSVVMALYVLGLLSALSFALNYRPVLSGTITLLLHCFFLSDPHVLYGWSDFLDPFLILLILSGAVPNSKWLTSLLPVSVCAMYVFNGWGQIVDRPWLDSSAIMVYLRESPFTQIYPGYRGFRPLVDIIGGFAWLAQLLSPLLFWQRSLARYWAAILLVLHILLQVFMPTVFSNWVMVASLILFLPDEWLDFNKAELKIAWRNFCFFFLMATMCLTIFDRNIAWQFDIFEKLKSKKLEVTYEIVTNPFVNLGNLILFNTIWKMYSPTWRHVVWIDWYYKLADGSSVLWPQDNFSPDYRMHRRTWLQAIWTDFKEEKVFVGMLSDDKEKIAYATFLCHEIAKTGIKPLSVHSEIYTFDIQGPDKDWSLKDQSFERKDVKEEVDCD